MRPAARSPTVSLQRRSRRRPRKAPKTCDNPGRASDCRARPSTRPLRTRSGYSGSSLRFRGRTLRDLAPTRGPLDGGLPAPAGANAKTRCFAPDAAYGRGPYGPLRFLERPGSDSGLNRHDRGSTGEMSRFLRFQAIVNTPGQVLAYQPHRAGRCASKKQRLPVLLDPRVVLNPFGHQTRAKRALSIAGNPTLHGPRT